jgi:hypothetical protein
MMIALGACGLGEYVDGTVPIPPHFVTDSTGVIKDVIQRLWMKSKRIKRK